MRTTIRMKDAILQEAKKRAIEEHKSLTALIEEAVVKLLYQNYPQSQTSFVLLPTVSGSGLRPGVDLNKSDNLLDLMESH